MLEAWTKRIGASVVISFLAISLGCASDSSVDKAVHSLAATRAEVVKAQNDLYETMGSLDALQNATGDLRPAYERFKSDLEATTAQAKRAEALAVSMRVNSAAYQKEWEDEASVINDPNLKTTAQERIQHVHDRYGDIRDIAQDCRQKYAVLKSDLLDINRYFANDLNAAAIERAKPAIETAHQEGAQLQARLNDLVAEMNQVTAEMNPTGKVPEK